MSRTAYEEKRQRKPNLGVLKTKKESILKLLNTHGVFEETNTLELEHWSAEIVCF